MILLQFSKLFLENLENHEIFLKKLKNLFLRNKTLTIEEILQKLFKKENEINLKLFRENIHDLFFFGKFSINFAYI